VVCAQHCSTQYWFVMAETRMFMPAGLKQKNNVCAQHRSTQYWFVMAETRMFFAFGSLPLNACHKTSASGVAEVEGTQAQRNDSKVPRITLARDKTSGRPASDSHLRNRLRDTVSKSRYAPCECPASRVEGLLCDVHSVTNQCYRIPTTVNRP
jgi:hypothetical protein